MIAFILVVKLSTSIWWFANADLMACRAVIKDLDPKQPTDSTGLEVTLEYTFEDQLTCINKALATGKLKADARQAKEHR